MTLEELVRDAFGDLTFARRSLGENHPARVHIEDAEDRLLEASSILGGSLRRGSDRVSIRLEHSLRVQLLDAVGSHPALSNVSDVVRAALHAFFNNPPPETQP